MARVIYDISIRKWRVQTPADIAYGAELSRYAFPELYRELERKAAKLNKRITVRRGDK